MGGSVAVGPHIGHVAADKCNAWEQTDVEPIAQPHISYDVDMKAGAVVGGCAKNSLAQSVLLGVLEVKFRLCVAHLNAIMELAGVESVQMPGSVLRPSPDCREQQQYK